MEIIENHCFPEDSVILENYNGSVDYIDSFMVKVKDTKGYSIDYLSSLFFLSFPDWVKSLMKIRNIIVKPFGLATGDGDNEQDGVDESVYYEIGDRLVFFEVIQRNEKEIVMAEDDKHLYFKTSILVEKNHDENSYSVHVNTFVKFHNPLGRIYFLPVKPFHKLIIKSLLKGLCKSMDQV